MKKILLISFCIFLGTCSYARASVSFNEIAWMGTSISSTNEWIELFNDGVDSVDLSGWKITTNDGGLSINLSGSIPAQGFYLIERTDDNTVPSVVADLVSPFGSGLSNSGEDIVLKDSTGNTIDSLSFSGGWPAGDNTTKDTMQKSNSVWITASSTPKVQNSGVVQNINSSNRLSNANVSEQTITKKETAKKEVVPSIKISITTPKRKIINHVKTLFTPEIIGLSGEKIYYGYFVWSMGDGNSYNDRQLKKIEHTYNTVGVYAVTLSYFENSWAENSIAEITIPVEVINPKVDIKILSDGSIELSNNNTEDISISNWKITNGTNTYTFPRGMMIFSNKKVIISKGVLGFTADNKTLITYPDGQNVLTPSSVEEIKPEVVTVTKTVYVPQNNQEERYTKTTPSLSSDASVLEEKNSHDVVDLTATTINSEKNVNTKYFVFAGIVIFVMVLCTYYIFYKRKNNNLKEDFDEYTLIDE